MATNDQVKQLAKAHYANDDESFRSCLLQIAAGEARKGHSVAARELKKVADQKRAEAKVISLAGGDGLFDVTYPNARMSDLIVSDEIRMRLERVVKEWRQRGKLADYGYENRRRILLEGAPGTGKTMTASVIASELQMPLLVVRMDKLITKYMGETSVKLRQIFDSIARMSGVYLFDEFDAIGADRSLDNEVGEMRRILNSFLQFIEEDHSESVIIAATNNRDMLDPALFRRFDDVLHYDLPTMEQARELVNHTVGGYEPAFHCSEKLAKHMVRLCQAEIVQVCDDAIKDSLLGEGDVTEARLLALCNQRLGFYDAGKRVS
jgi:SpoVK/Ycf46/Vps4 family AAA+-type ATPase